MKHTHAILFFTLLFLPTMSFADDSLSTIGGKISQNERIVSSSNDSLSVLGRAQANEGSVTVSKVKVGSEGKIENDNGGESGSIMEADNSAMTILGDTTANDASVTVRDATVDGTIHNTADEYKTKNTSFTILGKSVSNTDSVTVKHSKVSKYATIENNEKSTETDTSAISILGDSKSNTGSITVK